MRKICVAGLIGCLCFFIVHLPGGGIAASGITLKEDQNRLFVEYVNRLQDYPDFEISETACGLPEWEYSGPSGVKLKHLVEKYGLKEVAGQGTDVDKWLHIMDWVHRQLFRAGKIRYPIKLNTPSILEFVKKEGTAVNCRMYSIVLNEVLLRLGIIPDVSHSGRSDLMAIPTRWSQFTAMSGRSGCVLIRHSIRTSMMTQGMYWVMLRFVRATEEVKYPTFARSQSP